MSQKSIEFLEKISGLAYVPISEPANSVKVSFDLYFGLCESEDLPKSFKKRIQNKINSSDVSIKEIIEEIENEYARKEPYYHPTVKSDLDSISKTFDNSWFTDFFAIDRLHVAKKKLRKLFEEYVGGEIKSYEIDKLSTIGA